MNFKLSEILDRESWELKTLGEIATDIYYGNGVTKEQLGTGNFPAIKCGDINSKLPIQFTECVSFVDENLIKSNKRYCEYGDIVVSGLGDERTTGTSCVYLGGERCLAGNDVRVIKHNQNPRYLIYVLNTKYCRDQIKKNIKVGSTIVHLYKKEIKQIQIPLPPIEIQNRIADYLDKFTEMNRQLEAELEAELEERKIQYKYYRDEIIIGKDEEKMTNQNIRGDSCWYLFGIRNNQSTIGNRKLSSH